MYRSLSLKTLVFTLALVFAGGVAKASPEMRAQHPKFKTALRLYADFEFDSALSALDAALKDPTVQAPEVAAIHVYAGLVQAQLGDFFQAKVEFKLANCADPTVTLPSDSSPKIMEIFQDAKKTLMDDPAARSTCPKLRGMEPDKAAAAAPVAAPAQAPAKAAEPEPKAEAPVAGGEAKPGEEKAAEAPKTEAAPAKTEQPAPAKADAEPSAQPEKKAEQVAMLAQPKAEAAPPVADPGAAQQAAMSDPGGETLAGDDGTLWKTGIGVAAGGVALAVGGAVLMALAQQDLDTAEDELVVQADAKQLQDDAESKLAIGYPLLGVGGAAALTGIIMLAIGLSGSGEVTAPPSGPGPALRAISIGAQPDGRGANATVTFSF